MLEGHCSSLLQCIKLLHVIMLADGHLLQTSQVVPLAAVKNAFVSCAFLQTEVAEDEVDEGLGGLAFVLVGRS